MGSPSRNVQYHPPRLSEDRLNLPPASQSIFAYTLLREIGNAPDVKAAIVLFAALCDERLRRLFAGVEALQLGRGAEGWIADLLGIHRQTVAKGRQERLAGEVLVDRIRKPGAGRPRVEKKRRQSSTRSER